LLKAIRQADIAALGYAGVAASVTTHNSTVVGYESVFVIINVLGVDLRSRLRCSLIIAALLVVPVTVLRKPLAVYRRVSKTQLPSTGPMD
jgi:hypothetical protein